LNVITTHLNPDFDSFASAVAAQKLFNDHMIVLGGELSPALKGFLSSRGLLLSFYKIGELKLERLNSLIVVDTSDIQRLPFSIRRLINAGTEVKFFDHHLQATGVKPGTYRDLGACTTLMCTLLRKKKKQVTQNEASLFATAIYRETGNFTHANTKPQDLRTAAWLLDLGVHPDELGVYSSYRLSLSQQKLIETLLLNIETVDVGGVEVSFARAQRDSLPSGMSLAVEKLWSFLGVENLVVLVKVGERIYFTIRSRHMNLDLNGLGGSLRNGGGAFTMGYFEDSDFEKANLAIRRAFERNIERLIKVRDIMSSPVRTVLTEMRIEDVLKIMQRTGHHTLPVVDEDKIVGIARHRNVEKAARHNLGDRKIVEVMDPFFVVASANDSVQSVTDRMVENDTTSALVLENGILTGIVTRTDLLKSPFSRQRFLQSREQKEDQNYVKLSIARLMEERIEGRILTMLRFLGAVGSELGMPTYIVGGFVRDLLLNKTNFDLDIVVEGNANSFASAFKNYFDIKIVEHKEFLASSMFFHDGLRIDVATARTEFYKRPAALPEVDMSTIKKDLYRRDFSINAMAVKLNQEEFGMLIDFFGSRNDLAKGTIRALHPLSFIEDPTRVLRAIRFEQRFGFEIEVRTAELLKNCVREDYLDKVAGQRLREELNKILLEPQPLKAIRRFSTLGVIEKLFPGVVFDRQIDFAVEKYFLRRPRNIGYIGEDRVFYTLMMILLRYSSNEQVQWNIQRYGLPRNFLERLKDARENADNISRESPERPSEYHRMIKSKKAETLNFLNSQLDDERDRSFEEYLKRLKGTKLAIDGEHLKRVYGLKEGPEIREILDALYCARLDGLEIEKEDGFVKNFLRMEGI